MGASRTNRPSRMIVTRWQMANTSSRRCEMNSTAAPVGPQGADDIEEPLDLGRAQSGRRLVHHDDLGAEGDGFGDLDDLLVGDGEPACRPGRVELDAEPAEDASSASRCILARSIRRPAARGWRPRKMFSATLRSGNRVGSW